MRIDDDVEDFATDNENEIALNLAFTKSYVVERKNRRILMFKSQFLTKLKNL